ncbi:MAG: PEPxxWA-CTERM sorting domain-containing protein [Sphingomonas bacterium]
MSAKILPAAALMAKAAIKSRNVAIVCAVALGGMAGTAQAAPYINGAVTVSGGITSLPSLPSGSIVTSLTTLTTGGFQGGNGSGDLASGLVGGSSAVNPFSFAIDSAPATLFTFNGFEFTVTDWGVKTVNPFTCTGAGGQCTDGVSYSNVQGFVSKSGFEDTLFSSSSFQFSGTCNTSDGTNCTSSITAGWTSSIAAQGFAAAVPEPATWAMMILGMGMIGGAMRARKRQAKPTVSFAF